MDAAETRQRLIERINHGPPLLCDGAMGTELIARGLKAGESSARVNTDRPADVESVHRSYLDAGCDLVTTNTFAAGADAERNLAGARIARRIAGERAWVLGDVGPLDDPRGYQTQVAALREGEVDGIMIETMSEPSH